MAVPLGNVSDRRTNYSATDQTINRALDTDYVNGPFRRLVIVSVICAAAAGGQAMAGYRTVLGGSTFLSESVAGLAAGVLLTARQVFVFPVDPGGTYRVTSNVGAGASLTLQQWIEVDD